MSIAIKSERSVLNHDEFEFVRLTHYDDILDQSADALRDMRTRLRDMRDKERTLARHKRREMRGKGAPRGSNLPGTAEHPHRRQQVFAGALKRVNHELSRRHRLEARAALREAAQRALALRRAGTEVHHPAAGDTANPGMRNLQSRRRGTRVNPAMVGSVSQRTKARQAAHDARNT
jgi:hypothetical protein